MDQSESPVVTQMRMRVGIGRAAVRGPACVPDARASGRQRDSVEVVCQHAKLARSLPRLEMPLVVDDRDSRGVVASVLETLQPAQQDREALSPADVPHDSAHSRPF